MYFEGEKRIDNLLKMAENTRLKLKEIPGIEVYDKAYFVSKGSFNYDETKIIIKVSDLGLSGFEVYQLLMKESNIQLELAESHIVLAVLSIGTTKGHLDRLIPGFKKLSKDYYKHRDKSPKIEFNYQFPEAYSRPRDAYHAPKLIVEFKDAVGEVAAEQVMVYPPGIPLLIPGEIITLEVVDDNEF